MIRGKETLRTEVLVRTAAAAAAGHTVAVAAAGHMAADEAAAGHTAAADSTGPQDRCTRQCAQNAARSARSRSSPQRAGQFTAGNVSRSREAHGTDYSLECFNTHSESSGQSSSRTTSGGLNILGIGGPFHRPEVTYVSRPS